MNILITGGNRGLGLQLVLESVRRGHFVVTTVRDEQAKKQLKAALAATELDLKQVKLSYADVRDEAAIAAAAKELEADGIELNSIVNSAAILLGRQTAIEDLNLDDVSLSFEVNLFGPMRIVKHFLPLLTGKQGSIINISSEAGSIHRAYPGDYPYSLSKAALNLFSEQLKRLLAEKDVAVWSIHPGWMHTDMGGPAAPLSPQQSAAGILDIIERKVNIEAKLSFIDYLGHQMDI